MSLTTNPSPLVGMQDSQSHGFGIFAKWARLLAVTSVLLGSIFHSEPVYADGASATLYVYLQTSVKPASLEKKLEEGMKGVDVTVFGRFQDFKDALAKTPPDAVLARTPVLQQLSMKPILQGAGKNGETELMLVMSVDKEIPKAELESKTIGAVDLLGRKEMGKYVAVLYKMSNQPKLKPVTKTDDLLPLLQLNGADAVIVPESAADEIASRSSLNLKVQRIDGALIGLPALAAVSDKGSKVVKPLVKGLSSSVSSSVGVSKWQDK